MTTQRVIWAIVLATTLSAAVPFVSQAEPNADGFERCGDPEIVLVFLNPDLKPRDDGFVHASGTFFIQFQARGANALNIERLSFSFGKASPGDLANCDNPIEMFTGFYIKDYRADYDYKDGFFIPINTYNVGDGEYAAAISGFDKENKEIVRYFTKAVVENGRASSADPSPVKDFTIPWPMILPGDGDRFDGKPGLYIEIAEEIKEIEVRVNGARVEVTPTTPPVRDDDVVPAINPVSEGAVKTRVWGPAYEWANPINLEDIIKVRVVDKWDNVAEKVVHIGDPTIGGRVSVGKPEFSMELDAVEKETDDNGTATWNVVYKTLTEDGIHGDLYVKTADGQPLPSTVTAKLRPNHVMMGGKEQLTGTVVLAATPEAPVGIMDLKLIVSYHSGDTVEEKVQPMKLNIVNRAATKQAAEEATDTGDVTDQETTRGVKSDRLPLNTSQVDEPAVESPGFGLLVALGAAGIVAFAARRKR